MSFREWRRVYFNGDGREEGKKNRHCDDAFGMVAGIWKFGRAKMPVAARLTSELQKKKKLRGNRNRERFRGALRCCSGSVEITKNERTHCKMTNWARIRIKIPEGLAPLRGG